jgi:hypothetical protein
MVFSKFISFLFGFLGGYYFIIILFDILKSNNKVTQVTTHAVQFPKYEKPVIISDEQEESIKSINPGIEENLKKYLPAEDSVQTGAVKRMAPIIDLGLETLSGDAYIVNAENLSKFMIA